MTAGETPHVSVVVVNWNTRELLRGCLTSLARPSAVLKREVVVVDNGSTDGSAEMMAEEFSWVRLVQRLSCPSREVLTAS